MLLRRDMKEIEKTSDTVTGYCRYLIKEGYDPNWSLEVYRNGKINEPDVIVKRIGDAAKYVVDETRTPKLRKLTEKQLEFIGYNVDVKPQDSLKQSES